MNFNEKNFTSSFNNDRINKRESDGKSYNPRSVSPFLSAEKAMAGVSKRLAEEKNKAYTVAQSVAKNVWGEKEGKKRTSFNLQSDISRTRGGSLSGIKHTGNEVYKVAGTGYKSSDGRFNILNGVYSVQENLIDSTIISPGNVKKTEHKEEDFPKQQKNPPAKPKDVPKERPSAVPESKSEKAPETNYPTAPVSESEKAGKKLRHRFTYGDDYEKFYDEVYNNIVLQEGSGYPNIRKNYKRVADNGIVYAITRLIDMKKAYEQTEDKHARAIYAAAGKYLKTVIEKMGYGGSSPEIVENFTRNPIKDALEKENIYDGTSINNWVKALDFALEKKNLVYGVGPFENASPMDIDLDLIAIADAMIVREENEYYAPIIIEGRTHLTTEDVQERYNSSTGEMDFLVLSNDKNMFDDVLGEDVQKGLRD